MLGEILAVSAVGAVAVTLADHQNLFQNNPEKKFWWERVQWPWVVQPPAARARFNQFNRPSPSLTPEQQIQIAQSEMLAAQYKIANAVPRLLATVSPGTGLSKYTLSPGTPALKFEPYRK
jgi:hypothetical protein